MAGIMNIDEYKISRKNWQQSVEKWENILDKMVEKEDVDYVDYWVTCGFCYNINVDCGKCILHQKVNSKYLCYENGEVAKLYKSLELANCRKFYSAIPIVMAFLMFLYDLEYCVCEEGPYKHTFPCDCVFHKDKGERVLILAEKIDRKCPDCGKILSQQDIEENLCPKCLYQFVSGEEDESL